MKHRAWQRIRRLVILGPLTAMSAFLTWCIASASFDRTGAGVCALVVALLVLASGMTVFLRFGSRRFALAAETLTWVAIIGFPLWLAWDPAPPPYRPLTVAALPADAEAARATFLAGCKGGASDRWAEVDPPGFSEAARWMRSNPAAYAEFLASRREDIEAAWTEISDGRAWVDEMNSFPVISDFVTDHGSPILYFRAFRVLTQITMHRAALQASQGDGDGALQTLQPLTELCGQLRHGGRALVTIMIANVLESQLIATANFVLQESSPSATARAMFAATIDDGVGDVRDLTRCIETDLAIGMKSVAAGPKTLAALTPLPTSLAQPLIALGFNPQRFEAEASSYVHRATELTANRNLDGLKELDAEFKKERRQVRIKNIMGHRLLGIMMPAVTKVAARCWQTLDDRRALVEQLVPSRPLLAQQDI